MDFSVFLALASSSCLAAIGQLLLKIGADRVSGPLAWLNAHVGFGLAFYTAGLVLWMYGLSRAPLNLVYPFAILTFVLVGLLGIIVLGERPGRGVMIGWAIISTGIAIVYFSSTRS